MAAKKGPWSEEDDAFLMRYIGIGAEFISRHDLGRPEKAGGARMAKLVETGAAESFALAMMHLSRYRVQVGRDRSEFGRELLEGEAADWEAKALAWAR